MRWVVTTTINCTDRLVESLLNPRPENLITIHDLALCLEKKYYIKNLIKIVIIVNILVGWYHPKDLPGTRHLEMIHLFYNSLAISRNFFCLRKKKKIPGCSTKASFSIVGQRVTFENR